MKITASSWMKKLGAFPNQTRVGAQPTTYGRDDTANQSQQRLIKPGQGWQGLDSPLLYSNPTKPDIDALSRQKQVPMPGNLQQFSGRVGGNVTTANQTQPLSAILGGWFGQNQRGQMNPVEALMSWLSPNLPPNIAQMLQSKLSPLDKLWTEGLPQNITRRRSKNATNTTISPDSFGVWRQG